MTLPTVKKRKLINRKTFIKLAEKVKQSFEEEKKYLLKKKLENGDTISHGTYSVS